MKGIFEKAMAQLDERSKVEDEKGATVEIEIFNSDADGERWFARIVFDQDFFGLGDRPNYRREIFRGEASTTVWGALASLEMMLEQTDLDTLK